MPTVLPATDRLHWLEQRREGIGASDIAQIVGVSPYGSAFKVWADKTGRVPLDERGSELMRWGQRLEGSIRDEWAERTGLHVAYPGTLVRADEYPWVMATVDGVAFESEPDATTTSEDWLSALGLVEIKYDTRMGRWDEVPAHYDCQVQWQMIATGLDRAWLVVLHVNQLHVYEIVADPALQLVLLEAGERFWTEHVEADMPPPAAGDVASVNQVYRGSSEATVVEGDESDAELVSKLAGFKAQIKSLEADAALVEAELKGRMGDAWELVVDGRTVATWKPYDRKEYTVAASRGRRLLLKGSAGDE